MKKLAGRDFEDLLQVHNITYLSSFIMNAYMYQCSLPVFEELLPEPHNTIVLDLLFVLCTWHAYAKLRLHTTSTLTALEGMTTLLGHQLRLWVKKTCGSFDTQELPNEEGARHRRKAASTQKSKGGICRRETKRVGRKDGGKAKAKSKASSSATPNTKTKEVRQGKLRKFFNMCTYKLHALGHYVAAIARFGTTDGYSTQLVCI